ncbi:DUF3558 domain-containing protein [Saccharothrix sp. S26]|uniref:DUF3558 family protein n=1 Tax=Saccharothrix sp. S26 TaxID=2907215 RepID=UPI001F1ED88D|nr:DUF3558 family protein [Saccharothrix sp. S26]MCE6995782.1 DUF3558 domain-containing protein [Saccharothrix sp. S26]
MIKVLSARVFLASVVLGLVLTGCTTEGTPTPSAGSTTTEKTVETTTSTKASGSGNTLADFDACEALKSAAGLQLTEIEADGQACDAEFSATTSVTVKAQPSLKIDEAVGKELSDITVGSRKAKLVKAPSSESSCLVAIEVTATSRVDVGASANASQAEACEAATKVAEAIEPKLPK